MVRGRPPQVLSSDTAKPPWQEWTQQAQQAMAPHAGVHGSGSVTHQPKLHLAQTR